MRSFVWLGLLAVLSSACQKQTAFTQIVVSIDSDLMLPDQIDSVEVVIEGPDGAEAGRKDVSASFTGADAVSLPLSFGITSSVGAGPCVVSVRGMKSGGRVVERIVHTEFVEGFSLLLPLRLDNACYGHGCRTEQTCVEGQCVDPYIAPDDLAEFSE